MNVELADHGAASFRRRGFMVLRGVVEVEQIAQLRNFVQQSLHPLVGPA